MSADDLTRSMIAGEARIAVDRIRRGDLDQKDFEHFVEVSKYFAGLPLHIDDTPSMTLSELGSRCHRLKQTRGLALIVVDHVQLIRPPKIAEISRGLKVIATELAVPVLLLSQLSKSIDRRADKRPRLSDLPGAGAIERYADIVMFLHRDEYYLEQRMPNEILFDHPEKFDIAMKDWSHKMEMAHNRADLTIAKARHGPTGNIGLFFERQFLHFADLDIHSYRS